MYIYMNIYKYFRGKMKNCGFYNLYSKFPEAETLF